MTKKQSISTEEATVIALNFVRFLAADSERFERFCALTGLDRTSMAEQLSADNQGFLANILDYALQDESLLLAFSGSEDLAPETVIKARSKFPGAEF
jgi:hypothetical protein